MLGLVRPEKPEGFDEFVQDRREAIEEAVRNGKKLDKEDEFEDLWSKYVPAFSAAQCNKCGYCETKLTGQTAHIDHYRPKCAIERLPESEDDWGKEIPNTTRVRYRRLVRISSRGYYWLAYEWSNYVLACERCNVGWKRALFPVADVPRQLPPKKGTVERPLLLNPFDTKDPSKHLKFGELGEIEGLTDEGWATIDTCGLDRRDYLRSDRRETALKTHHLLCRWASSDGQRKADAYDDLRNLGKREHSHAGVVRAIVRHALGDDTLKALFGED